MKKIFLFFTLSLSIFTFSANAQDEVEATVGADVVSDYIWRGQDLGNAAIQPALGVSYKGVSLSAWGSVGIANASDTKEFDLTLGYTTGGFNVGITDYWFNTADKYFYYKNDATAHVFEANVGYDFGVASLQVYTNFAGADGVNGSGKRAYSTYVEAVAPFTLGGLDWTASLGFVPMKTSFYGADGFAVTNISLKAAKEIKITDSFSLPVFAGVTANPCAEKAYFTFGISL